MKRNTRVVWILCVCLWALSCLGCARNGNALASLLVSTGKGSAAAEQLFFDFGS